MPLYFVSFFAGILTVLAPCVFTLLPVILGGSLGAKNIRKPIVIIFSLVVSVFLFTLLLKASTALIDIPAQFWQIISGGILILVGITMLFPEIWEKIGLKLKFYKTEENLGKNAKKTGIIGEVLLGLSLGPVFSTCSPTYGIIIGSVLPVNFTEGIIYLSLFCIGLALPLMLIALGGRAVVSKLKFATNPKGWFKKFVACLLVLTGILIMTGLDKSLESLILDSGYLGPIQLEQGLMKGR